MFSTDIFAEMVEQKLPSLTESKTPATLFAPIAYTLSGGGKRLRPVLLLATAKAFGLEPEMAIDQALGIEVFHNFTLLHDDVMDNADVRRGRPAVHRRWNASVAILSGDAMLTMATQLMAKAPANLLPAVMELFNTTAMEVYAGQQLDMDFEDRGDVTVEEYIEMIRLKTSVLLACACRMGALLAGAAEESQKAMYRYGELLGLAFQLKDDLLDTYGDPALFGKEIGGDIINEKKTWLWINAMEREPQRMRQVLDKKLTDYLKIREITEIYDSLSLADESRRLIERYTEEAVEALAGTDIPAAAREYFTLLARKAADRAN